MASAPARETGPSSLFDMLGEMEESVRLHRQAQSMHTEDDPMARKLQRSKRRAYAGDDVHTHKERKHKKHHKEDTSRKDKRHKE
jgi:hypothetical protein